MKTTIIVITSVLGMLWIMARFLPMVLMSVGVFWLVLGLAVFGLVVARACKG